MTDGMPMPGGWTMTMAWMRMPDQTWTGAISASLGMWIVMMAAMMLPSLIPMLRRFREAVIGAASSRLAVLTAVVAAGYFGVWLLIGLIACPLGFALAAAEMQHPALSRAVPIAAAMIVVMGGASQFTAWKAHHLARCRECPGPGSVLAADARTAWEHGVRLGLHCGCCTAGLTAILLAMGMMDLRVMALVTAAITAERIAPSGVRVTRAIGIVAVGAGGLLLARAAGLQ